MEFDKLTHTYQTGVTGVLQKQMDTFLLKVSEKSREKIIYFTGLAREDLA